MWCIWRRHHQLLEVGEGGFRAMTCSDMHVGYGWREQEEAFVKLIEALYPTNSQVDQSSRQALRYSASHPWMVVEMVVEVVVVVVKDASSEKFQ